MLDDEIALQLLDLKAMNVDLFLNALVQESKLIQKYAIKNGKATCIIENTRYLHYIDDFLPVKEDLESNVEPGAGGQEVSLRRTRLMNLGQDGDNLIKTLENLEGAEVSTLLKF